MEAISMIGLWSAYLQLYLYVLAVVMLIGFGLPLLLIPLQWARVFRWEIPEKVDLPAFLGRSVGVFIIVLAVFAFKAASMPAVQPFYFDMLLWTIAGTFLIHVYGALKKVQPVIETLEILVWVLLFLATLAFYPA
jgi:hypothetical protein